MKFVRVLVVAALIGSLVGNIALYRRVNSLRMHVRVNDHTYVRGLLYQWLEQRHGREMTARMVLYELVTQAAQKAGVAPDKKEIEDNLKLALDMNPSAARQFKVRPWTADDWKQDQVVNKALSNLAVKDVKATDDELRDHFNQNPGKWDKPDYVYFKAVVARTADAAEKAEQYMVKVSDPVMVTQQLAPQAEYVGVDGTWAVPKPVGGNVRDPRFQAAMNLPVSASAPFAVERIPNGKEWIVLRKDHVVPGKKVSFEEVKDKVALDFKAARAKPAKEILRGLWDSANIQTDDPALKQDVERLLFPERFMQGAAKP